MKGGRKEGRKTKSSRRKSPRKTRGAKERE